MFDPESVAFEIRSPVKRRSKLFPDGYRKALITVYHKDPCRDGTDDSCGRFMRARHGDKAVLRKIEGCFDFAWDSPSGGWFNEAGDPMFSTTAIALGMFRFAAWEHFCHDARKTDRFMRRFCYDVLSFAENPVDSLHAGITGRYGIEPRQERIESFARSVYGCVLRWTRPWWRDPVFHVHHWRVQVVPLQELRSWWRGLKEPAAGTEAQP